MTTPGRKATCPYYTDGHHDGGCGTCDGCGVLLSEAGRDTTEYDRRGAMTNAPGPPSGPRWRCACGGWNPSSEAVCRFRDCDGIKTPSARKATP